MTLDENLRPGQTRLCWKSCALFISGAWQEGHPNPCRAVRWDGHKHHEPKLRATADGIECDCFEPMEIPEKQEPQPEEIKG